MGFPGPVYGSTPAGSLTGENSSAGTAKWRTLAKTDPYAAKLFEESRLWLDSVPDEVLDLLLEHPVIEHAWSSGSREAFHFVRLLGGGHADVKFLISNLAKLSVKVGGKRAATMLHRFLVAGEGVRLHAHEITVLHGLKLDEPIPLGRGAYLAAYDAVRKRFGLPEDPEGWLRRSDEGSRPSPRKAGSRVFTRRARSTGQLGSRRRALQLSHQPGTSPSNSGTGSPTTTASSRLPTSLMNARPCCNC